jgi:hypothetical protein
MGARGTHRSHAESRKKRRQTFHYRAAILAERDPTPRACEICDISETGARVTLAIDGELPKEFVLLMTASGSTRRLCRLVWRSGLTLGVQFIRSVPP